MPACFALLNGDAATPLRVLCRRMCQIPSPVAGFLRRLFTRRRVLWVSWASAMPILRTYLRELGEPKCGLQRLERSIVLSEKHTESAFALLKNWVGFPNRRNRCRRGALQIGLTNQMVRVRVIVSHDSATNSAF